MIQILLFVCLCAQNISENVEESIYGRLLRTLDEMLVLTNMDGRHGIYLTGLYAATNTCNVKAQHDNHVKLYFLTCSLNC